MNTWWIRALGAGALLAALQGCASSAFTRDIADDGRSAGSIVFPVVRYDGVVRKQGRSTSRDKLRALGPGMHKQQVLLLLGPPQFEEGIAWVREWDYLLDLASGGGVTSCQLKLLFDTVDRTGSLHWSPPQCAVFQN